MIKFENVSSEIYTIMIILAFLFFMFSKINTNHLVIIIIIILLCYASYFYLVRMSNEKDNSVVYVENTLNKDIEKRDIPNDKIFYIDKFPKKLKYLKQNKKLVDIITNIRFIRKFNQTIYGDIVLNANKLVKVYMYILSNRYDANEHLPIFVDIKDNIIELINSLIMIVPEKLKHTYGLDPFAEIGKTLDQFTSHTNGMLLVLQNYAKIHVGKLYIPDTKWKAYNIAKESFFS